MTPGPFGGLAKKASRAFGEGASGQASWNDFVPGHCAKVSERQVGQLMVKAEKLMLRIDEFAVGEGDVRDGA